MVRNRPFHLPMRWAIFLRLLAFMAFACIPLPLAIAQEYFELSAPDLKATSRAELTDQRLIIEDSSGGQTRYEREPRFDSEDGKWIGYSSRAIRQAIRWPVSGRGNMEIGSVGANGRIVYRPSRMTIVASNGGPIRSIDLDRVQGGNLGRVDPADRVLPGQSGNGQFGNGRTNDDLAQGRRETDMAELNQVMGVRLTHHADQQQFVSISNGNLSMVGNPVLGNAGVGNAIADWMMVPVANGMVRFQMQQGNRWVALGCHPQRRVPMIGPINGDPSQLWRWNAFPAAGGGYLLESVMFPGQALAFQAGQLLLQPIGFNPAQQWFPIFPPPISNLPLYRNVSSRVDPNPPLEPAKAQLLNVHNQAIFVLLADRRPGGTVQTIRIGAGESALVNLDRDAGSTIHEVHEVYLPSGNWDRQEYRIPVPPAVLYDISVYEEFLQSIAIDRTGKSPHPIEDVNFQPKSVGWFTVPPGNKIAVNEIIDVFTNGKAAKNPGAVRKVDPELLEKKTMPTEDPLRALLREFQGQRAAF